MSLKEKAEKLTKDIPAVYLALKKKNTPIAAKIFAAVTLIYALSPIDLIPDFIPVLGYLDDLIVLPLLIAATVRLIPEEQFEICRKESEDLWKSGTPKKWYCALPFVILWLLIIFLIVKAVFF